VRDEVVEHLAGISRRLMTLEVFMKALIFRETRFPDSLSDKSTDVANYD